MEKKEEEEGDVNGTRGGVGLVCLGPSSSFRRVAMIALSRGWEETRYALQRRRSDMLSPRSELPKFLAIVQSTLCLKDCRSNCFAFLLRPPCVENL